MTFSCADALVFCPISGRFVFSVTKIFNCIVALYRLWSWSKIVLWVQSRKNRIRADVYLTSALLYLTPSVAEAELVSMMSLAKMQAPVVNDRVFQPRPRDYAAGGWTW